MSASYRMVRCDRPEVVSAGSPELMGDFLRHEDWPPRRYEITSTETPFGCLIAAPQRRWTHPNGSVELVPDPST